LVLLVLTTVVYGQHFLTGFSQHGPGFTGNPAKAGIAIKAMVAMEVPAINAFFIFVSRAFRKLFCFD